jgi:hypothetical protein
MIAVGDFEYAGGKQINYIGSWNGREWNPLGSGIVGGAYKVSGKPSFTMWQRGINNCVRYQNDLHIAGTYEGIGSIVCGNVTRYDKGRLQCLDSGVRESVMQTPVGSSFYYTSFVSDMAAIGNNLYVAGNFTKAGNITANCAARWDGSTWKAMGNTKDILPYYPLRLSVDSTGGLLLAGSFTMIDGQRCNGLARWNGAQWSPVGFSQPADTMHINAICVAPNNDIYIAAQSRQQNGLQTERIKRWNGIAWQDLGGLFPDSTSYCTAIAVKGDLLYVAGKFSQAGTTNAINVAMLNTKTLEWLPLGSGLTVGTLNRTIQSIAFVGDTVYFGGGISYAGGKPSFNIAAWLPANTSSVEQLSAEIPENIGLTVSPNPVSTNGTFEFHLANRGNVRLVLADALGREVITVAEGIFAAGSYRATADVSLLPAGVYYARLQTAHGATGRAAVIER